MRNKSRAKEQAFLEAVLVPRETGSPPRMSLQRGKGMLEGERDGWRHHKHCVARSLGDTQSANTETAIMTANTKRAWFPSPHAASHDETLRTLAHHARR